MYFKSIKSTVKGWLFKPSNKSASLFGYVQLHLKECTCNIPLPLLEGNLGPKMFLHHLKNHQFFHIYFRIQPIKYKLVWMIIKINWLFSINLYIRRVFLWKTERCIIKFLQKINLVFFQTFVWKIKIMSICLIVNIGFNINFITIHRSYQDGAYW